MAAPKSMEIEIRRYEFQLELACPGLPRRQLSQGPKQVFAADRLVSTESAPLNTI